MIVFSEVFSEFCLLVLNNFTNATQCFRQNILLEVLSRISRYLGLGIFTITVALCFSFTILIPQLVNAYVTNMCFQLKIKKETKRYYTLLQMLQEKISIRIIPTT